MDHRALGVVSYGNPIADGRPIDTGELMAEPTGELPKPCLAAEQVIDTRPIGGDAGWDETRAGLFQVIELGCEKWSKSEIFTFERNQLQGLAPV